MLVLSGLHAMENSNNYLASIEYLAQPIILNWIGHPQFTAKNQEQNVNKPIQTREEYFLSEFYYKSDTIQYVDDIFIGLKGQIDSRTTLIYSSPEDVRNNSYEIRNGIIQGVKYFES